MGKWSEPKLLSTDRFVIVKLGETKQWSNVVRTGRIPAGQLGNKPKPIRVSFKLFSSNL